MNRGGCCGARPTATGDLMASLSNHEVGRMEAAEYPKIHAPAFIPA